ncbi:hypothetical protein FB008_12241 [Sinorhizobium medicae]|nr:hypothetical protein FB007_12436 [Sinorhizobium medicae]TWA46651.1 hypothetical protein FB008_12241 [Sinorhizobium medicae]
MMYRVEHTDTPPGRNQLQLCCLQPSFRTAAASVVVFDDTPPAGRIFVCGAEIAAGRQKRTWPSLW